MAGRRRKHHEEEEHENHERWLVSYADMITLLAALFIVLFAMSTIDLEKFKKFAAGLSQGFHAGSGAAPVLGGGGESVVEGGNGPLDGMLLSATQIAEAQQVLEERQAQQAAAEAEQQRLAQAEQEIRSQVEGAGLGDKVRFRREARGLVVTIVTDEVLFDLGSADLRPEGRVVLDALAPALGRLPNALSIEGHTDDRPILGGPFRDNWELSNARAASVLRYLLFVHGLPTDRVGMAGWGEFRPLVPNDSDANRDLNRRVEVVVLAEYERLEP